MNTHEQQRRRTDILLGHLNPQQSDKCDSLLNSNTCSGVEKTQPKIKIYGVGRYLPPNVITSEEIDAVCGLPKGYTERTSGVKERRYVQSLEKLAQRRNGVFMNYKFTPDEKLANYTDKEIEAEVAGSVFLAAEAAKEAIADAGISPSEIVYIINCSGTPERALPDNSCLVQRAIGLGGSSIPCCTVTSTCISFMSGLQMAAGLIESGMYNGYILLVCSEASSCSLNFTGNSHSAGLMGDTGAAVIVGPTPKEESSCINSYKFETYGEAADLTTIRSGGSRYHPTFVWTKPEHTMFHMDGKALLNYTAKRAAPFLSTVLPGFQEGKAFENIDVVIPHQASAAMLQVLVNIFGFPAEKIVETLSMYGNCVSVSLPLTLYEAIKVKKTLKRGNKFFMVGTAAGLTLGAMTITY
ncbi:beta-ketoacyl-ACP synthase III [Acrasis kona]|uniref:Beta-ketoacyl-ACP synthase III n=1 Tax=Acrasis kona TaxID=1008807 RepID=A0AAW2ZAK1_9EUKA